MTILEPFTFQLGPYTIVFRQESDRQWLYRVYVGYVLIGKSVSVPDEDACKWLERQQRDQTFYAYSSAPLPELSKDSKGNRRCVGGARSTRNRKLGAPRKPETLRDIEKALAGD